MEQTPAQDFGHIFDAFARMYEPAQSVKNAEMFKTTAQIRDIIVAHYGYCIPEDSINRALVDRKFKTYAMPDTGEIVWLLAAWDNS